jgi:hypothetical protein
MADRIVDQAVFHGTEPMARSADFIDEYVELAQRMIDSLALASGDGEALISYRWRNDVVAVCQTRGTTVRVLAVPGSLYRLVHDPFRLTREWAPEFNARGELPALPWIHGRPEPRQIEEVQKVLREGDGPTLLGAAQVLVDGGRLVFERSRADQPLIEQIWMLLPDSVRGELSIATFARSNQLKFDVVIAPTVDSEQFPRYMTERLAGDYPEGRYELAVQMAVEANNEGQMLELFARRSGSQAMRLAWTLLIGAIALGLAMRFIPWEKLR